MIDAQPSCCASILIGETMRRTIESKKEALITGLVDARQSILAAVRELPADQAEVVFLGTWCVKDLLAHMIGWDFTNLEAIQEIWSGKAPEFFQYYDKDWRSFNARLVTMYRKEALDLLLEDVEASHRQLIRCLQTLSAEVVVNGKAKSVKGRTVTIRNLLQAEAKDERVHAEQVRAFANRLSPG